VLELETESIISATCQRTIGNQDEIAVKDILAADIPYPLKNFFRVEAEAILLDELKHFHSKSRFKYDHPEIQSLQNQMNSALVLNYSFLRKEFLGKLDDAVHLLINYLIRPQWTLKSVLFENDQNISVETLLNGFRFFAVYDYFKEILTGYVREKRISNFTQKDLTLLLWKIDGEYVRRKSGAEFAKILIPLYDFFDYPKKTGNRTLPTKALSRYFEDKCLVSVVHRLEGEAVQGNQSFTLQEIGKLLEDVRRTSGSFLVENPIDKVESEKNIVLPDQVSAPQNKSIDDKPPVESHTDVPIIMENADKKRFVKKIFNNDENAFDASLRALCNFSSWKDASTFIDEVLIQYEVDPYSSEAKRFIEIFFEHFHKMNTN
jgi:hypothetical protein